MILDYLAIIVIAYAFVYLVVSIVIAFGIKRTQPYKIDSEFPNVSIIVCARNEENNIRRCLDSLRRLDYPREKCEIILVDDESQDNTLKIMNEYAERDGTFRVLSSENEPHDLIAKQRPLNLGIRESKGEIILITDADIAVKPGWIKSHVSAYHENTGIVGSTTRVDVSSKRLFDRVQCCDLITKHAVAMGSAAFGFPITIMGNNFSFRRKAYDLVGGLMGMNRSIVEDMSLMNAMVNHTKYTLKWIADKDGVVYSAPEKDFSSFVTQRSRWMSEIADLSAVGKLFIVQEIFMIATFIISLAIARWDITPLVITTFSWMIAYGTILGVFPGREKNDILYIPLMLIFQMIYSAVLVWRKVAGKRIVWKERIYE